MKFAAICGFACLVLSAPAIASGFSSFNAGIVAHNNADATGIIREFTAALNAPDLPPQLRSTAFLDRAEGYAAAKDYEHALADYAACLALTPDDYTALMQRGILHALRKEYDLSRADFMSAIRARPGLALAYIRAGEIEMAEQKYDDALKVFADGLAASWYTMHFYTLRSQAYRLSNRFEEAKKESDAAIQRDRDYAPAFLERGKARRETGDLSGANSDFRTASHLRSDDSDFQLSLGVAQWESGLFDDAEHSFKHATGDPDQTRYAFLWLYLTDMKQRWPGRGWQNKAARIDQQKWPGPIIGLIAGSATADSVFAAAKADDTYGTRVCEANFYVAEWQLAQGNKAEGKRLLDVATQVCTPTSDEFSAAKFDLKRLPA
jgi:tetratricopeptide (TPR) repeat protein